MESEYPKIILTRPKMVLDTNCPKCKSFDIVAFKDTKVSCSNCKTSFTSELGINIYYSIAKKLNMYLGSNNGVYVMGIRDHSRIFHPNDALKPRNKLEDDIWHAMLEVQKNFKDMKCWEVSEITNEYDVDYLKHCKDCGYCKNCATCSKCGKKYTPKIIKHKGKTEKRYTCPSCASKSFRDTFISKVKKKDNLEVCPYCDSDNIIHATFKSDKKRCPKCKTTNLSEPDKIPVYRLLIERQKRNWV